MNFYTKALQFFVENGITLTNEQLENLQEKSALDKYIEKKDKEHKHSSISTTTDPEDTVIDPVTKRSRYIPDSTEYLSQKAHATKYHGGKAGSDNIKLDSADYFRKQTHQRKEDFKDHGEDKLANKKKNSNYLKMVNKYNR